MGPRPLGRGRPLLFGVKVSLSLRQWGRDLSAAEGRWRPHSDGATAPVNGAATSRPRKAVAIRQPPPAASASMGPRPLGRGRRWITCQTRCRLTASMGPRPLGRGRSTRRRTRCRLPRVNGAATSRPRKVLIERGILLKGLASMGPRPLGRGRSANAPSTSAIRLRRQWGRDLSAAEGSGLGCRRIVPLGVNGAATSRPRKEDGRRGVHGIRIGASMGPRPLGRGRRAKVVMIYRALPASMGPRPLGRGRTSVRHSR